MLAKVLKERDEALLSLDKDKIIKYSIKHGVTLPSNDIVFWAGVHKGILSLNSATDEQKSNSLKWLIENGFSPSIS